MLTTKRSRGGPRRFFVEPDAQLSRNARGSRAIASCKGLRMSGAVAGLGQSC